VPLVAARGARVVLEAPGALQTLMGTLAGAAQIVTLGETLPDFDLHCPLVSLPRAFGTRLETIPSVVPYLHPSPDAVARWDANARAETPPPHRRRLVGPRGTQERPQSLDQPEHVVAAV
jgi:hypothetical protein